MAKYIMALDAGTTSNRCILFNEKGEICSVAQKEFTQIYPQPGWVEHNANEIWDTQLHVCRQAMEKIGAKATDIAVLVVAADDGIMPQTIEAINHAKAANIPIIVAVNKMDKPGANPDRILTQLTEHALVPAEWGGDTEVCRISAKMGMGIDELLETVILTAELQDLKANPNRAAKGTVIEARLDKNRGPIATLLVEKYLRGEICDGRKDLEYRVVHTKLIK